MTIRVIVTHFVIHVAEGSPDTPVLVRKPAVDVRR
jgi:hypothetical protein